MILVIKHISIEGPGLIGDYFNEKGYNIRTVELEQGENLPDSFDRVQAVVVLGGPMNVYEEEKYPYLKKENNFIKDVLKNEIPFLGLCLGAQLLAKASGAKVEKAPEEEIGFYRVKLTHDGINDAIFKGVDGAMDVFQWHGDTFSIPDKGVLLAKGEKCRNQAFRIGKNAYGFQFHLEVDGGIITDWSREYFDSKNKVLQEKGRAMIARYEEIKDGLKKNVNRVCRNFEGMIIGKTSNQ